MADGHWVTEAVFVDDEGRFLRDVPADKPEYCVPVAPVLSIHAPVDAVVEFRVRVYRRRLLRSRRRLTDEEIHELLCREWGRMGRVGEQGGV